MKKAPCFINSCTHAFSLVESLLAIAIISFAAFTFLKVMLYGQQTETMSGMRDRAAQFAKEGLEAARNIRDASFSNLTDGIHGLAISSNQWIFTGVQDTQGQFTRQIQITPIDAARKQITSTVTWMQTSSLPGSVSLVTYLTNWRASTKQGGRCVNPFQRSTIDIAGDTDALKIQVSGSYAYAVRNDGVPDFVVFDIHDPDNPSIIGSLSLPDIPTNIYVSGSYAYVSSKSNTQELQVVSIATPASPSLVASYDAAGSQDANGIFVSGTAAYLVRSTGAENEFLAIDITTPTSPSLLGSLDLGGTGYEVYKLGNYAYIASGHNSQELQIVSVANPAAPALAGSLNLSGNTDALTVFAAGSYAYLGRGNVLSVIDVSNVSSPFEAGSLNVTGSLLDIDLTAGSFSTSVYLATDVASKEFQVVSVTNPTTPVLLCSLDIAGNNPLFGISYDPTTDTVYAVGSANDGEFIIIAPQ